MYHRLKNMKCQKRIIVKEQVSVHHYKAFVEISVMQVIYTKNLALLKFGEVTRKPIWWHKFGKFDQKILGHQVLDELRRQIC